MPLSEHEQRLLEEMERSLYRSEGDHVTTVGASTGRASFTAIVLGVIGVVVGIGLLVVGIAAQLPVLGILGFVVMFAGAVFAIAPPLRFRVLGDVGSSNRMGSRSRSGLMDSLGERWDRRGEGLDRS